ncbi:DNA photolyase family protein [Patescibacteria group bacterium]|nr:DNA photolyase family protein [Patescibacteria group bacterium]
MPPLTIYWSRRDLRLADNPALLAASSYAVEHKTAFLPLFILEDYMTAGDPAFQFGCPSRWFLSEALPQFASQFEQFAIVTGKGAQYLIELGKKYQLTVFVNDDVYIDFYKQITKLQNAGVNVTVLEDALSVPKDTRSGEGNLYSVFTPFKKNVWARFITYKPQPTFQPIQELSYLSSKEIPALPNLLSNTTGAIFETFSKKRLLTIAGTTLDLAELIPLQNMAGWYTTEAEALKRFADYLKSGDLDAYKKNRDSLELDAANHDETRTAYTGKTSKMSLALAWGLVSARTLMQMMQKHFDESFDNPFSTRVSEGALTYISELIWREFYRYQLFHRPDLMDTEFQKKFQGTIQWVDTETAQARFLAWMKGETGYSIVDAAMKQLAETGWMHNRSRMIVASILTKNFGVDWRWGQEYFRAVLIDLDEASNNGGWQWGASVGADPKPIRIFNAELQAKNYDASGAYQERWLRSDGAFSLNAPSVPIIEHKQAREEALMRYGLGGEGARDY